MAYSDGMARMGLMVAILLVLAWAGAVELVLRAWSAQLDPWLLRAEHVDPARRDAMGARVSGAARWRADAPMTTKLGVVVGFSTAREGLPPGLLEGGATTSTACDDPTPARTAEPNGWRWLNLGSSGGSFYELSAEFEPLVSSMLAPDRVVLAVHPAWLAGRIDQRRLTWEGSWLWSRRLEMRLWSERMAADAKLAIRLSLGVPVSQTYPPAPDPFATKSYYQGRATEEHLARQWDAWTHYGWFAAAQYSSDVARVERVAFGDLIRGLSSRSPDVWVVLMPESARLRAAVPPEAVDTLVGEARSQVPEERILDLRTLVPDEEFFDYAHLGACGQRRLVRELTARLAGRP